MGHVQEVMFGHRPPEAGRAEGSQELGKLGVVEVRQTGFGAAGNSHFMTKIFILHHALVAAHLVLTTARHVSD